MRERHLMRPLSLSLALALSLGACTVGPQYTRPDTRLPTQFDQAQAAGEQAPASPLFAAFQDPALNGLIDSALAANTGIAQAVARLDEVRALRGLEKYALYPTVTAAADQERSNPSSRDPFVPSDIAQTETWRAGFDAVWEIDLFGGIRSSKKAIVAEQEAAEAALRGVRQAVTAEVAQAYFALRGAQQRLRLKQRTVDNLRENLRLLELRRDAGRGTDLDVARSNALGLSIASELPLIEAEVVQHEQRLAVLTTLPIDTLRSRIGTEETAIEWPQLVQTGTPEEWLRRRPDVAEAERRLAAATARVGIDVAEFFPKLNLLGGFGYTAQSSGDLLESQSERWRFGPSLSWSFLDFGRIQQRVLAAEARADGAMARYQETVLRALEETETALANYRAAQRATAALSLAVTRATDAARLARIRFDAGAVDFLVVLDAERTQLDLEDQLARTATQRGTALAALYKALAGDFARAS